MASLPKQKRSVPLFRRGAGDRREDCASYGKCLSDWCYATLRLSPAPEAHCPPGCEHFAETSLKSDLEETAGSRPGEVTW